MVDMVFPSSRDPVRLVREGFTNLGTSTILFDEPLPQVNGLGAFIRGDIFARSPADFRHWEKKAWIERVGGSWALLGGGGNVFDVATITSSAGASSWVFTPGLPGSDTLRSSGTGVAGVPIRWVIRLEVFLF